MLLAWLGSNPFHHHTKKSQSLVNALLTAGTVRSRFVMDETESESKFDGLVGLEALILQGHSITRLPSVKNMKKMLSMLISSNLITTIAVGDFKGAESLVAIDLGNNKITSVAVEALGWRVSCNWPNSDRGVPAASVPVHLRAFCLAGRAIADRNVPARAHVFSTCSVHAEAPSHERHIEIGRALVVCARMCVCPHRLNAFLGRQPWSRRGRGTVASRRRRFLRGGVELGM